MLDALKHKMEYLKDRVKPLSEEESKVRHDICKACDHYISMTTQCTKCGCFMKLKTALPFAECPIGKWGKVFREYPGYQDKKD
jgi:hypothetical protein